MWWLNKINLIIVIDTLRTIYHNCVVVCERFPIDMCGMCEDDRAPADITTKKTPLISDTYITRVTRTQETFNVSPQI